MLDDLNKKVNKTIKGRLLLTIIIVAIIFVLFSIKIYILTINNNEEYNQIVLSQRQANFTTSIVKSKRGNIYDVNGKLLATSEKVYNLILDPYVINSGENAKYLNATIYALNEIYGYNITGLKDLIVSRKNSQYVRYAKNLSYDQKAKFEEYTKTKNQEYINNNMKDRIKGVWFEDEYKRIYPYKSLASNVIGFTNNDGTNAIMGLELYYNDELSGVNGKSYGFLNNDYNLESVQRPEIDGKNIITTIDIRIQSIIEKHINDWQKNDVGSKDCAVIIMDPYNGDIKAMAASNSFDLNKPRDLYMYDDITLYDFGSQVLLNEYNKTHNDVILLEDVPKYYNYETIIERGKTEAYYKNWKNNCIQNTFEPGSTSKIFTVAGALDENLVNEETEFLCEGKIELSDGLNDWTIRCNNRLGHGELNLISALTQSCNMSMATIADKMGIKDFSKYQKIFGFGQKTDIDLPYEANTSNLVYNEQSMGKTALATNSFGQNYNCTMIQMVSAYASLLNGGTYYTPHILKRIENDKGAIVKEENGEAIRNTVSNKTAEFIKKALVETVIDGTGKSAGIENVLVGGKTGTAEKLPRSAKNYIVSFCGFTEVEGKDLLCYVIIDQPNQIGEAQARSSYATKLFKSIMKDVLNNKSYVLDNDNNFTVNTEVKIDNINIATVSELVTVSFNNENTNRTNITNRIKRQDEELIGSSTEDSSGLPDLMP